MENVYSKTIEKIETAVGHDKNLSLRSFESVKETEGDGNNLCLEATVTIQVYFA